MSFASWLRTLKARFAFPPAHRSRQSRRLRRMRVRLALEPLENRLAPAVFTVNTTLDTDAVQPSAGTGLDASGNVSLRSAIETANYLGGNNTIQFGLPNGSLITLTNSSALEINNNLTITGLGASNLAISGNNQSGVFTIDGGAQVTISGVTIEDGKSSGYGGGIYNSGTLTVSNSTLADNSAPIGGGIENVGVLTVNNSTLANNSAMYEGGGIDNGEGGPAGGTVTVSNSTLEDNSVTIDFGGGIFNSYFGTLTVISSTLTGNSAPVYAGGIFSHGKLTVSNSTLADNSSNSSGSNGGGGIVNYGGTATVSNSTLSGNSTTFIGGGILNEGALTVTNSTLADNAAQYGGGIINYSGSATLNNTIVADSTSGGDLYVLYNSGSFSGSYDLIGDGSYLSSLTNSLQGNPLLAPLGYYGGPTETMALLPGSIAIGAGDPSQSGSTDQRGFVRGSNVDIGAFQSQTSPLVVNTTDDTATGAEPAGQLSLRDAINLANVLSPAGGANTITFDIPASDPGYNAATGTWTVTPASALPAITASVILDGTSQPGFNSTPVIVLSGVKAGSNAVGLDVTGGNSTIKGLVINQFGGEGIALTTNGGDVIEGNYIGTDATGTQAASNGANGVFVTSDGNTIGGTTASTRNLISGNDQDGVGIFGADTTGNVIEGNYIGTDVSGTADIGNGLDQQFHGGIYVTAPGTTIGGTESGAGNLISGNYAYGVQIQYATQDILEGNLIGTNAAGTAALPSNWGSVGTAGGVFIYTASDDTIGGTISGARNVISGNQSVGININSSSGILVEGNFIGTDISGTNAIANNGPGVECYLASNNTIGGMAAGAGNIIADNTGSGVAIGNTTTGDRIVGDSIDNNQGSGITNSGSAVTVSNCTLAGNSASSGSGGGICNSSGTATVSNCTLTGNSAGSGNGGGGIYSYAGKLTVNNCNISNNTAVAGGGIVNYLGSATLTNTTFDDNTAQYSAGALANFSGKMTLTSSTLTGNRAGGFGGGISNSGTLTVSGGCTLSGNSASSGGGIACYGGTLTVNESTLTGNTATGSGGGIEANGGKLRMNNSILANNKANTAGGGGGGGGIQDFNGTSAAVNNCLIVDNSGHSGGGIDNNGAMTITNSTLSDNSTSTLGGGICSTSYTLTAINCTFAGNSASKGGGLFNYGSKLTVSDSTVADNSAVYYGGGIASAFGGSATLNNTIVADSTSGGDLYLDSGNGSTYAGAYDLIGDGSDLGSFTNSLQGNPLLAPLGNYGGPTQTMALLPGSPAIDAGNNALAVDANGHALTADQRGEPYLTGNTVDIGAFESQSFAITATGQVALALNANDLSAADQAAGFTYTINWGDNTTQTVPATANNGIGTSVSHTYSAPGLYAITVTATNQAGTYSQTDTALAVISSQAGDSIAVSGGSSQGQVAVTTNDEGNLTTTSIPDQVLVAGSGGSDTYTVNFGSTLTTPITITGGGSTSGDTLVVNGDDSSTNVINKTAGKITWGSPVTETILRAGIPNTTINANGTTANYINDPGGNTTINGGSGANFITITATTGSGVVIYGGPTSNTYTVDLGGLAGQVAIQNNNTGTTDNLVVNGANENNNITLSGNQITEGTQTITDNVPLTDLAVNAASGNNKITNQITVDTLTVPVQNLTLTGGGAATTYNVNAGNVNIVAGTGQNVVNVSGGTVSSNLPLTSIQFTSSANASQFGQQTTFTAVVSSSASGTPTGSVDFFDTTTNTDLGNGILSGSTATLTTSALGVGTHAIQAIYGGDSNFLGTSATLTQTVNPDATTTALSSSVNHSIYGQGVTLTSTVSANAPGSGTPTGSVDFFDSTTNTDLGSVPLSGDVATLNLSSLAAGSHAITATYSGDGNFLSSASPTDTQMVRAAATTTSNVNVSGPPAVYGQPVVLSVTVSNTQTSAPPSGSVTFKNGSRTLGTALVGVDGTASLTVSTFAPGSHSLTASFSDPAGNFVGSNSAKAVALTITQASTTTALTTNIGSSVYGQAVTFMAAVAPVAPSAVTPTGTVTFSYGSTKLATVALKGGTASFTTSRLAFGTYSVIATYTGNADFGTSSSPAQTVTVGQDATTAVVTSSLSSPVYGQAVTLTAKVKAAAPGSGTPTGSVTFYDGTTALGTATLSGGMATLKTTALTVGSNSFTVVYSGDSNFQSTTSAALAITVKHGTKTQLTSSSSTASVGQSVTFTATVLPLSPGSGMPTGSVTFWDGSVELGTVTLSNGVASFSWSFTTKGYHKIKAVYNGDPDFMSSTSSVLTETIN